jgi:hypothetical protein
LRRAEGKFVDAQESAGALDVHDNSGEERLADEYPARFAAGVDPGDDSSLKRSVDPCQYPTINPRGNRDNRSEFGVTRQIGDPLEYWR